MVSIIYKDFTADGNARNVSKRANIIIELVILLVPLQAIERYLPAKRWSPLSCASTGEHFLIDDETSFVLQERFARYLPLCANEQLGPERGRDGA